MLSVVAKDQESSILSTFKNGGYSNPFPYY